MFSSEHSLFYFGDNSFTICYAAYILLLPAGSGLSVKISLFYLSKWEVLFCSHVEMISAEFKSKFLAMLPGALMLNTSAIFFLSPFLITQTSKSSLHTVLPLSFSSVFNSLNCVPKPICQGRIFILVKFILKSLILQSALKTTKNITVKSSFAILFLPCHIILSVAVCHPLSILSLISFVVSMF